MNTKQSRLRRARKTRAKIAAVKAIRLAVHPHQLPYLCPDHFCGWRHGSGQCFVQ